MVEQERIEAAKTFFAGIGMVHHESLRTERGDLYSLLHRVAERGAIPQDKLLRLNALLARHSRSARGREAVAGHVSLVEAWLLKQRRLSPAHAKEALTRLHSALNKRRVYPPRRFPIGLALIATAIVGGGVAGIRALESPVAGQQRISTREITYKISKPKPIPALSKEAGDLFSWMDRKGLFRERRELLRHLTSDPFTTIDRIMLHTTSTPGVGLENPLAAKFTGTSGLDNRLRMLTDLHLRYLLVDSKAIATEDSLDRRLAKLTALHTPPLNQEPPAEAPLPPGPPPTEEVGGAQPPAEPGDASAVPAAPSPPIPVLGEDSGEPAKFPRISVSTALATRYESLADEFERAGDREKALTLLRLALNLSYEHLDARLADDVERSASTSVLRSRIQRLSGNQVPPLIRGRARLPFEPQNPIFDSSIPLFQRLRILMDQHVEALPNLPILQRYHPDLPFYEKLGLFARVHMSPAIKSMYNVVAQTYAARYSYLAGEFSLAGDEDTADRLEAFVEAIRRGLRHTTPLREYGY